MNGRNGKARRAMTSGAFTNAFIDTNEGAMKNRRTKTLGIALLALALLAYGCAEDEVSMLIVGNEAPNDLCEISGSTAGPFKARGVLDISLTKSYIMTPVVLNQLLESANVKLATEGSPELGDAVIEGNTIILEGAEVSFSTNIEALQQSLQADLFIPIANAIFPGGSLAVPTEVISTQLGLQIEGTGLFAFPDTLVTILINIKFRGKPSSGTEVVSSEFSFPLDICAGRLLNYPPNTLGQDDDRSLTCDSTKLDPAVRDAADDPESVCLFGQDQFVDCRLCRSFIAEPSEADETCDPAN